jgi:hypothetical protein
MSAAIAGEPEDILVAAQARVPAEELVAVQIKATVEV